MVASLDLNEESLELKFEEVATEQREAEDMEKLGEEKEEKGGKISEEK